MLGASGPDYAPPNGTDERTVVVLQTHYIDKALIRFFGELAAASTPRYEAVLLMHAPAGNPKPHRISTVPHHFVTTPEIRCPASPTRRLWGQSGIFGKTATLISAHYTFFAEKIRNWIITGLSNMTSDSVAIGLNFSPYSEGIRPICSRRVSGVPLSTKLGNIGRRYDRPIPQHRSAATRGSAVSCRSSVSRTAAWR